MAKAVLAFEATKITHGEEAAVAAWRASAQPFGSRPVEPGLFPSSTIPRSKESCEDISAIPLDGKAEHGLNWRQGIPAFELFHETDLCASRGEARRLIAQGGGYVNDRQLRPLMKESGLGDVDERGEIRLRKGKKKHLIRRVSE